MFYNRKTLTITNFFFIFLVVMMLFGCKKLVQISFVDAGPGNGGDNEHPIHHNSTNYDGWGDGAAIVDPVWIADGSDSGSEPDKNEHICYIRSKPGVASRLKVEVVIKVKPSGKQFSLVGMDGATEYFRQDNLTSTGSNQTVSILGSVNLPTTVCILTKTFAWKVIMTGGQADKTYELGSSTHKIYIVFDTPIVANVEGQTNKLTPKRLDFSVGAASGESDKVAIANKIAYKVWTKTGYTYGPLWENPRWLFYARTTNINTDCHHRAALAASAFGIAGIKGYVHKVYATCYPVPPGPWGPNPTVNDYTSHYTDNRFKWRTQNGSIQKLYFVGNNFEGNIRVEDDSVDDGNAWWTIWPFQKHNNAKELLQWFASSNHQLWSGTSGTVLVPTNHLANKPKIIGGPN